uniref:CSON002954 protein n=1 Tax=Culicoides sonorensis TaxID=179676 RepID=A0A336L3X7_CULSO
MKVQLFCLAAIFWLGYQFVEGEAINDACVSFPATSTKKWINFLKYCKDQKYMSLKSIGNNRKTCIDLNGFKQFNDADHVIDLNDFDLIQIVGDECVGKLTFNVKASTEVSMSEALKQGNCVTLEGNEKFTKMEPGTVCNKGFLKTADAVILLVSMILGYFII